MNSINFGKVKNNMQSYIVENSSNIAEGIYDSNSCNLIVVYKNGGRYRYQNVTVEQWNNFKNSDSKGRFINQNIKSKECKKVLLND